MVMRVSTFQTVVGGYLEGTLLGLVCGLVVVPSELLLTVLAPCVAS